MSLGPTPALHITYIHTYIIGFSGPMKPTTEMKFTG